MKTLQICFLTLTHLYMHTENLGVFINRRTGKVIFDTYIWLFLRQLAFGKSDWQRRTWDDSPEDGWCNTHIFHPIKINCSKFFNLKTDVSTTNQEFTTASQKTKNESASKAHRTTSTVQSVQCIFGE